MGLRLLDSQARREFLRRPELPSFVATYRDLQSRGVSFSAVVDVGANRGEWSRELHAFFPKARILMVEPQPGLRNQLSEASETLDGQAVCAHCLLGASVRENVPFEILDDGQGGSGSSLFPENSNVPRHVEHLPMTTLDRLLQDLNFPPPDFLKIDTQGSEIEVLKGAKKTLASVECVALEVSTWPFNLGAPLLPDVLAWMSAAGFVTHDLCGVHRLPDGRLCQMDLLFVRAASRLRSHVKVAFGPRR